MASPLGCCAAAGLENLMPPGHAPRSCMGKKEFLMDECTTKFKNNQFTSVIWIFLTMNSCLSGAFNATNKFPTISCI